MGALLAEYDRLSQKQKSANLPFLKKFIDFVCVLL